MELSRKKQELLIVVKNPPANAGDIEDVGSIPESGGSPGGGHGNSLQYSCQKTPRTKEPGRLQSMGSERVGHNWSDLACMWREQMWFIEIYSADKQKILSLKKEPVVSISSVQLLSHVRIFATPRNAACQASLSFTNSWNFLKLHEVSDAIHPSYPLLSPSPPAFSLSQHQALFQWISSSDQVAKVLELQLQHQSFQWIFRTDFL